MKILCSRKLHFLRNRHQETPRNKFPTEVTCGKFPDISDALARERERERESERTFEKYRKRIVFCIVNSVLMYSTECIFDKN
jgi:hypothetical protein